MTVFDFSKHLLDNGATGIPWKPEEERRIIDRLVGEAEVNCKEGDIYYVISASWFDDWMKYTVQSVSGSCMDDEVHCGGRPGPIDNTDIVEDLKNDPQLCRCIAEESNYKLLPHQAWKELYRWYKGGPALPRKMILGDDNQLKVEVFLWCLTLIDPTDMTETETVISLSGKATMHELYERVCQLKNLDLEKVRLRDISNKDQVLISSETTLEKSMLRPPDHDILVEVQVNGTWPSESGMDSTDNKLAVVPVEPVGSPLATVGSPTWSGGYSRVISDYEYKWSGGFESIDGFSSINGESHDRLENQNSSVHAGSSVSTSGGSTMSVDYSGGVRNDNSDGFENIFAGSDDRVENLQDVSEGMKGLTGLHNLGNTCYMNSALQCLVHTSEIWEFFNKEFVPKINKDNPDGHKGKLTIAFGSLLIELMNSGRTSVLPDEFKKTLDFFAPQFKGYGQHDSQEFIEFLLNGLHEDLNRVKQKTYIEAKDSDGRADSEVADEQWNYHKSINDSVIADAFEGQYQATLVCPVCDKKSVRFDPFMHLSLPLPSRTMREITVTVFYGDESSLGRPYTVTVPIDGCRQDLQMALAARCFLGEPEHLLLAEVFQHLVRRYFFSPTEPLSSIKDLDYIVAYSLPKRASELTILEISHRHLESATQGYMGKSKRRHFLTPLVTVLEYAEFGADLDRAVSGVLSRLRRKPSCTSTIMNLTEENSDMSYEIYITNDPSLQLTAIEKDTPIRPGRLLKVRLEWCLEDEEWHDVSCLMNIPRVSETISSEKKTKEEAISLFSCLDAFTKEEPLGPDDAWFCPHCKEQRKATTKLDFWRLPDILIVHLKRFSFGGLSTDKIGTFVDFPIHNLDLSKYVKSNDPSGKQHNYELYAVSNHHGRELHSGHYTTYCKLNNDKWYVYNDDLVSSVEESAVKTADAYVLFYERMDVDVDEKQSNGEVGD